jgi:hypothetical protein
LKPSRASAPSAANGPEIDVENPMRTWSTGFAVKAGAASASAHAARVCRNIGIAVSPGQKIGGRTAAAKAQV